MINAADRVPRQVVRLAGRRFSVAVSGEGPAIVLLHGSATHAYTWRNIIPYLARGHRCLAPDLPGMGRSELDWRFGADLYSFSEQAFGIAELVQAVVPDRPVVLIGHELGAMMAAQFAREHPSSVAGLVFVEGAFRVSNDTKFDPDVREFLGRVRSEEGKSMILRENLLVKFYLNRLTFRHLGPEELRGYGDPYARSSRSRQAMLSMIRQLPLRSDPGPINDLADQVRSWCQRSTIPKLVVGGKPGFLVPPAILATTARWTNTRTTSVRGLHFLTEDSPARITSTILDWLNHIGHMPPSRDSGDERTDAVEVSPYLQ